VPWQLESSARAARRPQRSGPGDVRRGIDERQAHDLSDPRVASVPSVVRPAASGPAASGPAASGPAASGSAPSGDGAASARTGAPGEPRP
jgi:hypothetical protein